MTIRPARSDDVRSLLEIELHAGEVLRTLGMDAVADDEPFPTQLLVHYQEAGRAWVAEDADEIVGYLLLDVVAGPRTLSKCRSNRDTHDVASGLN